MATSDLNMRSNVGYIGRAAAVRTPDELAVVDVSTGVKRARTFAGLDQRMDRVASAFSKLGLQRGDRVALLIGNRVEYVESMFGLMRAGFIPVLVNTKLALDGMLQMIRDVDAAAAIVDSTCNASAAEVAQSCRIVVGLDVLRSTWLSYESLLEAASVPFEPIEVPPAQPAFICFTSGSTGRPKGIPRSHAAQLAHVEAIGGWFKEAVGGIVRSPVYLPMFHTNAVGTISYDLHLGGLSVILPGFDPRALLKAIAEYRLSNMMGIAAVYVRLINETDLLETLDLSSLRRLMIGSAPSGGDLLARAEKALGAKMWQAYGTSETGSTLAHSGCDPIPLSSCGVPLPHNELKLIDPETGLEASRGELWIRNPYICNGYWNQPELTAQKFVDGWYRTGDILERDAKGHFYVIGRADDMINVNGEKVYPAEIEALLMKHPDIIGASVVAVSDPLKGGQIPVAMIVKAPSSRLTAEEVKQFALANGPAYAHPRVVEFVDTFPTASTGKIDRRQVSQIMGDVVRTVRTSVR